MKTVFLMIGCFTLLFTACNDSEMVNSSSANESESELNLSEEELISVSYDDAGEISFEDVCSIIDGFRSNLNHINGQTRSVEPLSSVEYEQNKYYVNLGSDNVVQKRTSHVATRNANGHGLEAPIYEVAWSQDDKKSIAIVSADKRAPKVLVYIPQVEDGSTLEKIEFQVPLAMAQASLVSELKNIEFLRTKLRSQTMDKISRMLKVERDDIDATMLRRIGRTTQNTRVNSDTVVNGVEYPLQQILGFVLPLSHTSWGQKMPYNRALPEYPCEYLSGSRGHALAGCGVIALAQALAVTEPANVGGVALDWPYIKQKPSLLEALLPGQPGGDPVDKLQMVGNFIKALYLESETTESWTAGYASFVSSSTTHQGMAKVLSKYTKYSPLQVWNPDSVKRSLDNFFPVLNLGNIQRLRSNQTVWERVGHAFLIDGFLICERPPLSRTILKSKDMYWHANLGWNATGQLYYALNPQTTDCTMIIEDDGGTFYKILTSWMTVFTRIRSLDK